MIAKNTRVKTKTGGMQGIVQEANGVWVKVHWDDDTFDWRLMSSLEVVR